MSSGGQKKRSEAPPQRADRRRSSIRVDAVQVRFSKGEVRASYSEADDRPSLKLRKKATIAALKHTLEALENGKVEDGGMSGFAGGFWDLLIEEKEEG